MNILQNIDILLMGISLMPIAHLLGRLFLFRMRFDSAEWRGLVFQVFGFGILSYVILIFGLGGFLSPSILWGLYWVLLGLSSLIVFEWWGWLRSLLRSLKETQPASWLFFSLGALILPILLVMTLAPELGGDALTYHLGTPKFFLEEGRIHYSPYDINSIFPFLVQMLYLLGIALKGAALAKFFHLIMGFMLFVSLFLFLRDHNVRQAFFWSLLFILTPGIVNQIPSAHTDVALTLYTFLGCLFFLKALTDHRWAYFGLSGAFWGYAFSIKAIGGILLPGLFGLGVLWMLLSRKEKYRFSFMTSGLGFFILTFLLMCSFWYLRAYVVTGNPFFPYFESIFGKSSLSTSYDVGGMGIGWLQLVSLPWNLIRYPLEFGNRWDQVGPLFLVLSPFLIWGAVADRTSRFLAGVSGVAILIWFCLAQRSRFLYPILPLLFSAQMIGFHFFEVRFLRFGNFVRTLFIIPLLGLLALTAYHARFHFHLATGYWSERQFLEKMERTTVLTDYLHHHLPQTGVKILNLEEIHRYPINVKIVRGGLFGKETRYWEVLSTPEEVIEFLKAKGFTHVLWASPVGQEEELPVNHVKRLVRDPKISLRLFELVFEARSQNIRGTQYDYALYRIR